jgi:hypothetical protein
MAWVALTGDALSIQAGAAYTVVADVSTSHSKSDILSQLQKRGLSAYVYSEGPISDGTRPVTIAASAASGASIPWSPSFPVSLVAHYEILKAWVWAGAGTSQPTPPQIDSTAPTNRPARATTSIVFLSLGALAGVGWYAWSRRR